MTQLATFEGEQADHYAGSMGPMLEQGMPQAMQRLADEMVRTAGAQS
ncbi:MAG TPA: hypothetical protein VFD58_29860 [Blastocatellia bacterium]|nr:hypothetical protein [Blastocatellia bacterium]